MPSIFHQTLNSLYLYHQHLAVSVTFNLCISCESCLLGFDQLRVCIPVKFQKGFFCLIKKMAALSFTNELQSQLKEAGNKLSIPPSSIEELLDLLDTVEDLLSYVGQAPSSSMQEALLPSMGALISDELLRHSDVDVNISVASCISEITRITAPDTPYNDEIMKEIFQLNVVAFGKLSHVSGRCYSKALHILNSTASVQSFFLMMDMEFDDLVAEMFHQFLSTIRSNHPHDVFQNMEKIMTKVIEESEEVSVELLSLLLSNVKKENLNVSPISWKLGEKIFNNCAGILKAFLPGMMQSMSLDPENYAQVVASICQDAQHKEAEGLLTDVRSPGEIGRSVDGLSKSAMDNGMEHESFGDTLSSCHQSKQQTSSSQRSLSPTETEEPDRGAEIPKKRERKPNSRLGGYLIREETELEVHHRKKKGDGLNFLRGGMHGAHSQEKASQSTDGALKEKPGGTKDSKVKVRNDSRDNEVADKTRVETTPAPSNIAVKEGILSDAEGTVGPSVEKVKDKKRKRGKATSGKKLVSPSATTSMKKGGNHSSEALRKKSAPPKEKAHEINENGEELVGRRIKVWWPLDQMFYDGAVAAFDPSDRKHTVRSPFVFLMQFLHKVLHFFLVCSPIGYKCICFFA